MTAFTYSLVVIVPEPARATAIDMAETLSWDAGFAVPLSADGGEPATHWGLHAVSRAELVGFLTGQVTPAIPGYSDAAIADLRAALVVSAHGPDASSGRAHFDAVLAEAGLQRVGEDAGT